MNNIIIKSKVSGKFFVDDTFGWSNAIEHASFYISKEEAQFSIQKNVPTIDLNTISFFLVETSEKGIKLKFIG